MKLAERNDQVTNSAGTRLSVAGFVVFRPRCARCKFPKLFSETALIEWKKHQRWQNYGLLKKFEGTLLECSLDLLHTRKHKFGSHNCVRREV